MTVLIQSIVLAAALGAYGIFFGYLEILALVICFSLVELIRVFCPWNFYIKKSKETATGSGLLLVAFALLVLAVLNLFGG